MLKTQLDTVWGSLLWASRDLDWVIAKGPFLLNCPVKGNASPKVLHYKSWQAKQTHSPPGLQNVICNVFFNEISLLKYSSFKICHNRCYF